MYLGVYNKLAWFSEAQKSICKKNTKLKLFVKFDCKITGFKQTNNLHVDWSELCLKKIYTNLKSVKLNPRLSL